VLVSKHLVCGMLVMKAHQPMLVIFAPCEVPSISELNFRRN
jgi:hypothetical protein